MEQKDAINYAIAVLQKEIDKIDSCLNSGHFLEIDIKAFKSERLTIQSAIYELLKLIN